MEGGGTNLDGTAPPSRFPPPGASLIRGGIAIEGRRPPGREIRMVGPQRAVLLLRRIIGRVVIPAMTCEEWMSGDELPPRKT